MIASQAEIFQGMIDAIINFNTSTFHVMTICSETMWNTLIVMFLCIGALNPINSDARICAKTANYIVIITKLQLFVFMDQLDLVVSIDRICTP